MNEQAPSKELLRRYRFTKSGMFHNEAGEWVSWFDHNQEIERLRREQSQMTSLAGSALTQLHAKCSENEPRAELAELAEILVRYADWFYTHDHEPRGRELSKLADKLRAAQPPCPKQRPTGADLDTPATERDWWRTYAINLERERAYWLGLAGQGASPPEAKCEWGYDAGDDVWHTTCGQMHCFNIDGPTGNDYKWCPYCRNPIDDLSQPSPTKPGEVPCRTCGGKLDEHDDPATYKPWPAPGERNG